jgi:thioredoxin-like negative regulator of GroEL
VRLAIILAIVAAVVLVALLARRARARRTLPVRIDPADLGSPTGPVGVLVFTSRFCHACQQWKAELDRSGTPLHEVDVGRAPEVARRYGIAATPVVLAVRARDGRVLAAYDDAPRVEDVERVVSLAAGA